MGILHSPHLPQSIVEDSRMRPHLFVAQKTGGVLILDVSHPQKRPLIISRITKKDLAQLDAMNLTQQGQYLYVALGDFFSARGAKAGLAVIDVKNPNRPQNPFSVDLSAKTGWEFVCTG